MRRIRLGFVRSSWLLRLLGRTLENSLECFLYLAVINLRFFFFRFNLTIVANFSFRPELYSQFDWYVLSQIKAFNINFRLGNRNDLMLFERRLVHLVEDSIQGLLH